MITEQIMTEKGLLKAEVDKTSVKTNSKHTGCIL